MRTKYLLVYETTNTKELRRNLTSGRWQMGYLSLGIRCRTVDARDWREATEKALKLVDDRTLGVGVIPFEEVTDLEEAAAAAIE